MKQEAQHGILGGFVFFILLIKGMEHIPTIFMSFDEYFFLEVINILISIGLFKQSEIQLFKKYLKPI